MHMYTRVHTHLIFTLLISSFFVLFCFRKKFKFPLQYLIYTSSIGSDFIYPMGSQEMASPKS